MPTLPTLPTNAHARMLVGNVGNLFSIAHIAHKTHGHMATRPGARMRSRVALVLATTRLAWAMADCPQLAAARLATLRLDANGNHLQLRGVGRPARWLYLYRWVRTKFFYFSANSHHLMPYSPHPLLTRFANKGFAVILYLRCLT